MNIKTTLLASALLAVAAGAHAAAGVRVLQRDEALVSPGMTQAEVRDLLGRPETTVQYHNEIGPTFTYRVADAEQTLFDIDFGADGRVLSVGERMDLSGRAGSRR